MNLITCFAALSLTSLSFAQEGKTRGDAWFNELDADGDGRVSKKEYIDAWNARFSVQDKDGNKHLDFAEWSRLGQQKSKSVSAGVYARKVFGRWDKDADGQISQAEYGVYRSEMFDGSDTDKDGYWSGANGE